MDSIVLSRRAPEQVNFSDHCLDSYKTDISAVFLQDFIKRRPVFAPFTSPIYSNDAFRVLSFALESITNPSFTDMMNNMFVQLDLSQTSYTTPTSDVQGVIPWNISYSGWDVDEAAGDPCVPLLLYVVISITVSKQCRFNLRLNSRYVQSQSIHPQQRLTYPHSNTPLDETPNIHLKHGPRHRSTLENLPGPKQQQSCDRLLHQR